MPVDFIPVDCSLSSGTRTDIRASARFVEDPHPYVPKDTPTLMSSDNLERPFNSNHLTGQTRTQMNS